MANWMPAYSSPRHYMPVRSNKPRTPVTTFTYDAKDAWSAAAAVTRLNGGYVKEEYYDADHEARIKPNKVLVREMLEAGRGWTDEDVARGAEAREYWKGGLIKIMAGTANSFESSAISIAGKDTIESAYDLAVLSSLVASADRGAKRDELNQVKSTMASQHVGRLGDAIQLDGAEIMSSRFVASIGKNRNEARHGDNLYTWWGHAHATGAKVSIKGKVKAHITDRDTGAKVTQLNYTKVRD